MTGLTRTSVLLAAIGVIGLAGAPAQALTICNIHQPGYTQAQCSQCGNMTWSISRIFPRGVCVANGNGGGSPPPPGPVASSCTPTHWGGATLPLSAPNFSRTGAAIGVCRNGYDPAKSQLRCSSGTAVPAPAAPKTNVTCSGAAGPGANPQVTINGTPCCL